MNITLETLLEETANIPALPHVVTEILNKIDDPSMTPNDFQNIIINDPVLTAKTLKLSNSAYYGYSREISTISEAIVILGIETLKSLVIAMSAYNVLNRDMDGYGLKSKEFWEHSLMTALISQGIGKIRKFSNPELLFIAGLLHDIGKLLLSKYRVIYLDQISEFKRKNKVPDHFAEKAILKFDHCEVGSSLANLWKFPNIFVEIIRYHHWPTKVNNQFSPAVHIVHMADCFSHEIEGTVVVPNKMIAEKLAITDEEKSAVLKGVKEQGQKFTNEIKE